MAHKIKFLFPLLLFLLSLHSFGANPLPGMIPLSYMDRPSNDLLYQGKPISPEELHLLYQQQSGDFDHSVLDPVPSGIWKNELARPLKSADLAKVDIDYYDEVQYLSPLLSRAGNFRFTIQKTVSTGEGRLFTLLASKRAHNVLLRQALLYKLGYQVPAIKHLKKIQLRFKSENEKKLFITQLGESTFGSTDRWITRDADPTILTLQDMLAIDDHGSMYNLSIGFMPPEVPQGRRTFRSLLIPYSLVEIPESVNLFDWSAGRIISNNVMLPYDDAANFDCTYEDAKWITNRILRLTRADWEEIVEAAAFPSSVAMLVKEKLFSRRNSMGKLLRMDGDELEFNPHISNGTELIEGELKQEFWPGYAGRFSFGDPENPLSASEVTSFVLSEGVSNGLLAATTALNSIPYLGTNLDSQLMAREEQLAAQALAQNVTLGEPSTRDFGAYVFPMVRGQFILGRKVVAGTYLGTNNRIQLVDTIGVSVSGGAYIGFDGIPTPLTVGATAQANLSRTYAHIRPITSIKRALKYPFKNILVPLLKRKYGHAFDNLVNVDLNQLAAEEKQKRVSEALKLFTENMEVGESIIITDSISAGIGANVGVNYLRLLAVGASVNANEIVISRLHIQRKSENIVHLYRDFGNLHQLGLGIVFRAGVPVLKAQMRTTLGMARSKFIAVNIDKENPDIIKTLGALRHVFFHNSLERIEKIERPYKLKYNFTEGRQSLGFLIWRYDRINSSNRFTVTHPEGESINLYRKYRGRTFGTDPVGAATEALAALPAIFLKGDYVPPAISEGNAGNNYFGKAENIISTFEGEVTEAGLEKPFLKVSRIWNGFSASRKKALKLLEEVKQRYQFSFYPKTVLNEADKLYLYNINVNFLVYADGIQNMFNLAEKDIRSIFDKNQNKKRWLLSGVRRFLTLQKKYHKAREKKSLSGMANAATRALILAEDKLNLQGITKLVGGDENLYVYSKLEGFRVGDENGDSPYLSNSLGEFGEEDMGGPLTRIQRLTGMSEGEFFLSWLMGRLI
ncbi:MAG: hypothetical protein HYV97_09695 [Bdellovibrio sp.]|nr:hypothetical protein [Bdellovibrio sp.]